MTRGTCASRGALGLASGAAFRCPHCPSAWSSVGEYIRSASGRPRQPSEYCLLSLARPLRASCSEDFVVAGLPLLSRSSGKMAFELEVLNAEGELFVGLAGSNFRGVHVGADETSWAFTQDGWRMHK